jgi:hypothetical protein
MPNIWLAIPPIQGVIMFKVEINISDYGFDDEKIIIECSDFDKVSIIQEFIQFQKDYGWAVEYDFVEDEDEIDEDEESEEYEIGETV